MLPFVESVIGVAATVSLAASAVRARALTPWAGVVATLFGSAVVVVGGFPFLALLVLFVVASTLATRYRFEEKRRQNLQEGMHGERGVTNVMSHIVVPTGLVLVAQVGPAALSGSVLAALYMAALAFGAADTFASEFGVLAGRARSLLSGREVPAGTNGGVTWVGELWGLVGSATTALIGVAVFALFQQPLPSFALTVIAVTLAGFLGCQIDSLFGETLENRGWLSKGGTNYLAMLSTVTLAAGIGLVAGLR